jgi:hypothetical protein
MKKRLVLIAAITLFLTSCSTTNNLDEIQNFEVDYTVEMLLPNPTGDGNFRCEIEGSIASCFNTTHNENVAQDTMDLNDPFNEDFEMLYFFFPYIFLQEDFLNEDMTELRLDKLDDFLLLMTNDEELQEEIMDDLEDAVLEFHFVFKDGKLIQYSIHDGNRTNIIGDFLYND